MKLLQYVSFAPQVRTLQTLRRIVRRAQLARGVQLSLPAVRAVSMASTVMKVQVAARHAWRGLSSDRLMVPASHACLEVGVDLVQHLALFAALGLIEEHHPAARAAYQVRLAAQLLATARIAHQAGPASHRLLFVKFAQQDFTAATCQVIALFVQQVVLADQTRLTAASALLGL